MDDTILMGTLFTEGVVMVDDKFQLITAAFHSNCGGQTCNAEDVWNKASKALRSVRDTFCQSTRNAHWEKEISRKAWVKYLLRKNAFVDSSKVPQSLNFAQPRRRVFYEAGPFIVALRDIRADWALRSTFFSVEEAGDKVFLKGRGFGHGIGLCQEGAIRRARFGQTYLEILHVYYKGITLMNRRALNFFSEDP
jgi:stage II sporulation protein D